MAFFDHNIELKDDKPSNIIKVIGVGGGGSNAVRHMYEMKIQDVDFVVCNTDLQALNDNSVPTKLQLGAILTEGLGAGTEPEQGRLAAEESAAQITALLEGGTKMVQVLGQHLLLLRLPKVLIFLRLLLLLLLTRGKEQKKSMLLCVVLRNYNVLVIQFW